jgi:hypothetical protein
MVGTRGLFASVTCHRRAATGRELRECRRTKPRTWARTRVSPSRGRRPHSLPDRATGESGRRRAIGTSEGPRETAASGEPIAEAVITRMARSAAKERRRRERAAAACNPKRKSRIVCSGWRNCSEATATPRSAETFASPWESGRPVSPGRGSRVPSRAAVTLPGGTSASRWASSGLGQWADTAACVPKGSIERRSWRSDACAFWRDSCGGFASTVCYCWSVGRWLKALTFRADIRPMARSFRGQVHNRCWIRFERKDRA